MRAGDRVIHKLSGDTMTIQKIDESVAVCLRDDVLVTRFGDEVTKAICSLDNLLLYTPTQFIFNGRKYLSPNKDEVKNFCKYWDSPFSQIFHLETSWKITVIERAPGWVPVPVFERNLIEYSNG